MRDAQLSGSSVSKSLSDTKEVIGEIAADPDIGQEDDSLNIVECNRNSTTIGSTCIVADAETFLSDKITENNSGTNTSLHDSKLKAMTKEEPVENTESEDRILPRSSQSDFSDHSVASVSAPNSEAPLCKGTCSLLSDRVRVYPRKADMVLPKGANALPFSDEAWVAVSLDFSEQV